MEIAEARVQLQRAVDASHVAPTAKYLRQAAAACLKHGLQPVRALPGLEPHIQFEMQPVSISQVAEHVRTACPEVDNILERLQGKTGSKYFVITYTQPIQVLLVMRELIQPAYQQPLKDLLASIKQSPGLAPQAFSGAGPPGFRVVPVPIHATNTDAVASALQAKPVNLGVGKARAQLHTAIVRSHGSHTARWMTEAAWVCLQHGLTATDHGLQLAPVNCRLVIDHLRPICPDVYDVIGKLQTLTGQKYFRLMGSAQSPSAILLKLANIILSPARTIGLAGLMDNIQTVTTQHASSLTAAVQQTKLNADQLQASLPDTLDLTPPGFHATTAGQAFDASGASTQAVIPQVAEAQRQLKMAVSRSHPPTAKYIVETAAVCLDHGLFTSETGFFLKPVAWSLIAEAVHTSCPHIADLLEKLCGKTGQKYFQLLGNSEFGEPEFVAANLGTLILPKQMPFVSHILNQFERSSPAAQKNSSASSVSPNAPGSLVSPTATEELHTKQWHVSQAVPSSGQIADNKSVGSSLLAVLRAQPASSSKSASAQGTPRAKVTYAPVPISKPRVSDSGSKANGTETGSTSAMQALLSACMQIPENSASDGQKSSEVAKWVPAVSCPPASTPFAATALVSASSSASIPASLQAAAPAPIRTQSKSSCGNAEAKSTEDPFLVSSPPLTAALEDSPSSSISGITQAMKARSSASTELSSIDVLPEGETRLTVPQQARVDPFCLDCMEQPGRYSQHPLVPSPAEPESAEVQAQHDTHTPSDCSTQEHTAFGVEPLQRVAVVLKFEESQHKGEAYNLSLVQVYSAKDGIILSMKEPQQGKQRQELDSILEDNSVVKVVHDAGQAANYFFSENSTSMKNVFDTQIAQGVLDHMSSLMGSTHHQKRRSLGELLLLYELEIQHHPEALQGMEDGTATELEQVAAAEAAAMLQLAERMSSQLGVAGKSTVYKLCQALVEQKHVPANVSSDRSLLFTCLRVFEPLPGNVDLEMTFPQDGTHKPIFRKLTDSSSTHPIAEADGIHWQAAAMGADHVTDDGHSSAGPQADPDMQTFLQLLPVHVRDAIIRHLTDKQGALQLPKSQQPDLQGNGAVSTHSSRPPSPKPSLATTQEDFTRNEDWSSVDKNQDYNSKAAPAAVEEEDGSKGFGEVLDPQPGSPASLPPTSKESAISGSQEGELHQEVACIGHDEADVQCDRCGKWGHTAASCDEMYCDRCQQMGYIITNCKSWQLQKTGAGLLEEAEPETQSVAKQQKTEQIQRFRCKQDGHSSAECPLPDVNHCYNCHQLGHLSQFCPVLRTAVKGLPLAQQQGSGKAEGSHHQQAQAFTAFPSGRNQYGKFAAASVLTEVIADKGRSLIIRFSDGSSEELPVQTDMTQALQTLAALDPGNSVGDLFDHDNRLRLDESLHQVSAIRKSDGHCTVVGLTYRIGRHMPGVGNLILDVLSQLQFSGRNGMGSVGAKSLLILGGPATGKTTLLRDVANIMANVFDKHVVVVDTNNEIGGNGAVPDKCLGRARRMSVHDRSRQHEVLLQAAQNHKPQAIVVDTISSSEDVRAVKSIIQRGIAVIATAEAICLSSLINNPELNSLLGEPQHVGASKMQARYQQSGIASTLANQEKPIFTHLIELLGCGQWRVHSDVPCSVSAALAGTQPNTQLRMHRNGKMIVRSEAALDEVAALRNTSSSTSSWLNEVNGTSQ